MALEIVILAAGQGSRMRSRRPKVLHTLGGKPLLQHVIERARELRPERIHVVYGHGGEQVLPLLRQLQVNGVLQAQQLGTGHALLQALPHIDRNSEVLVLYGDVPLLQPESLAALSQEAAAGRVALLTFFPPNPHGYGRIVRSGEGDIIAIVEQREATAEQQRIGEVNSGIIAFAAAPLPNWLGELKNSNAQGEYYLTDLVALAVAEGVTVVGRAAEDPLSVTGVNDRLQLQQLERIWQRRQAEKLLQEGVELADANRIDIRGSLRCGQDVSLDVGVIIEGEVTLADGVTVGAYSIIRNSQIGERVTIEPMSLIESAVIAAECTIGPYARLRPGTELEQGAKIGNFVEVKQSTIGRGSKVNHLSYIGDTTMGSEVNIGAGTITCNYDGANKHQTVIGDRVFVGSDTQLVAPVEIADGATIGAGSTITKTAPAEALTLSRSRQVTILGWQRPQKGSK